MIIARFFWLATLAGLGLVILALTACGPAAAGQVTAGDGALATETDVVPTASETSTFSRTAVARVTSSPSAAAEPAMVASPTTESTLIPTLQPTLRPTVPPTPTATPSPTVDIEGTATSLAIADPLDRSCPDPPPAKPDYDHFYLDFDPWPTPEAAAESHFWLAKPLPGGGRFLYTEWLPYGYDAGGRYLLHNGVDAAEPLGTPVLAAADGTVVVAGDDATRLFGWRCDWYGHLVVIELDQQWRGQPVYVLYGHVLNLAVRPGERVTRGQPVAEVGVGGAARLAHLHFEVRVGSNDFGSTRNPFLWLEPPASRGLIAGRLVDPDGRPWQGVTVVAVARSEGAETRTTWTYLGDPQGLIGADEALAENFLLADLLPGEYELYVELQGEVYKVPVSVAGGQLTFAEIVSQPLKTTPEAPMIPEVAPTPAE